MPAPILLVEDDVSSAILTEHMLEHAGLAHDLIIFARGADALLYLESGQPLPAVILLDLGLPDMHGLDVLKYIRHHDQARIRDLCVLILTVSDDQETVTRTIEHGANAFLSKNLNVARFLEATQNCGIQLEIGNT